MRRWPLLRNRDYVLLWSGQGLLQLGSQTSTVAYRLLVLGLTGSAAKAGVVGLAKWLPLALFALPAGALADRMDRKRLMITTDAIRLVGAASIVVALWLGRPRYLQIVLVAFLDGAMVVTSWVTEKGALGQVVPPAQVQDAVAQNERLRVPECGPHHHHHHRWGMDARPRRGRNHRTRAPSRPATPTHSRRNG